jgi:hypothetical protein
MMKRPPKDLGKAIKSGYQPMFMTGPEIKKHFPPLEGDKKPITTETETRTETNSELWDRKLKESKYTGEQRFGEMAFAMGRPQQYGISRTTTLAGIAAAKGMPGHIAVQTGNSSDNGQILGGHHRVALSADQFKDHIFPVKYHSTLKEAQDDPGYR